MGPALLGCSVLARRFRVAPPVLLLACGALLGFAPALRRVYLPPEVVLLLFLPALARLPRDGPVEQERHLAETLDTEEAIAAIPQLAADLGTDPDVVSCLRREYEKHLRVLHAGDDGAGDEPALRYEQQHAALRLAVIAANGPPWSGCGTNAASTTPSSVRSKPGSTSRKYA